MSAVAEKVDLYKERKADYVTPKKPVLVDIEPATYLAMDGVGEPASDLFQSAIGALYGVAYTTKMASKKAGRDYAVCKLEGLWWGMDEREMFTPGKLKDISWKLMIRTPDFVSEEDIAAARETLVERGKGEHVDEAGLERIEEGRCVQMLHVGPYATEPETVAKMNAFIEEQGLKFHGRHHEIYLSDPRRVAEEKLRTILRLPVVPI